MKVDSVEQAYGAQGVDPNAQFFTDAVPERYRENLKAFLDAMIVTDTINGEWVPDRKDPNQKKYEPVFLYDEGSPGSGLVFYLSSYVDRHALAGSRLGCENHDNATHLGEKFLPVFERMIKHH